MKNTITFLSTLMMLFFISCNNDDATNNSPTQSSIDVYVAGSVNGNACYYKNDELILLDGSGFSSTYAREIFVYNKTYIFGAGREGSEPAAISNLLWTNGTVTNLNVAFSETGFNLFLISDFYVYNDDVYFVGYLENILNPSQLDMVYWKNGVKTTIIPNATYDGNGPSIIVNNDDVYVYLKNTNNEYEIFINDIFYPISQNYGAVRMATKNNEVYIYGKILFSSDGFYYNTNTGVETLTPLTIDSLVFDDDDIYTLALRSDGSFLPKILKNNVLYYQTPAEFIIDDFFVRDGILYLIERDFSGPQIVFADYVPIVTLDNPTSYSGSFLGDIYIVQN